MKRNILIGFLLVFSLCSSAQLKIEKIKPKHIVGNWYSENTLIKFEPNVSFVVNRAEKNTADSTRIINLGLNKNETFLSYMYDRVKSKMDTDKGEWLFVDRSHNIKLIEVLKLNEDIEVVLVDQNGQYAGMAKVDKVRSITTLHIDSLFQDKMYLRVVVFKKEE